MERDVDSRQFTKDSDHDLLSAGHSVLFYLDHPRSVN